MKPHTLATLAISTILLAGCSSGNRQASGGSSGAGALQKPAASLPMPKPSSNEFVIKLTPSWVHIEVPSQDSDKTYKMPLVHGTTKVGPETVNFYLPAQGPYSLASSKPNSFANDSTSIMVDANGDGQFDAPERWYASSPVRLGDRMFSVKQIDPGGKWIEFADSSAKLSGLVIGKPCPDFRFFTTDGTRVSLADYKGKALLLDIWSMT
ncbi:MAG TPA: hypothetical protein V6C81_00310 [Planktothrix sp.]|jgi:hypothetical protein